MNTQVATIKPRLTDMMASKFNLDRDQFVKTVKATCIKEDVTDEQFAQFLLVANEYDLNPFTKEIYAFPSRGGIQPIVSVDGWLKIINNHDEFDGMVFEDHNDAEGKLISVTCKIYRKDRQHPTEVTEYMAECKRGTDTWKNWPARMLRHKATIQAARYAFGLSGLVDPDEAERIRDMGQADVVSSEIAMPVRASEKTASTEQTTRDDEKENAADDTPIGEESRKLIKSQLEKKGVSEDELFSCLGLMSYSEISGENLSDVFDAINDIANTK